MTNIEQGYILVINDISPSIGRLYTYRMIPWYTMNHRRNDAQQSTFSSRELSIKYIIFSTDVIVSKFKDD